jgi:hypothetical protein
MASTIRLKCPECKTEYDGERFGLPEIDLGQIINATVKCVVCQKGFDAKVTPKPGVVPGWFYRVVLRQKPTPPSNEVVIQKRG